MSPTADFYILYVRWTFYYINVPRRIGLWLKYLHSCRSGRDKYALELLGVAV